MQGGGTSCKEGLKLCGMLEEVIGLKEYSPGRRKYGNCYQI